MKYFIVIASIFMLSCSKYKHLVSFENKISEMVRQNSDAHFRLNLDSNSDFNWDKLLILRPYSVLESIETEIGYNLDCVPHHIEHHDSFFVLVFFDEKICQGYIELKYTDFSGNLNFRTFLKSIKQPLIARNDCSF